MPNPELTPKQQWSELVKSSQSILVVTHQNPDGDALGSALAMKLGLEKLGKTVSLVAAGNSTDPLAFLPSSTEVETALNLQKDLLVMLDESQAKIGNISLKRVSENKLIVVITPKSGLLSPANARIEEGSYNVDLIIVLDCSDLDRIGDLYQENSSLFYEVPVVNIDHHPGNTNFGKVNIVDLTASSTAEILVSLLETVGRDVDGMLDADIATCLLTGITTDTGSFQNANTTPKSLTIAAQMVAAGARQQEIIRHIFKTRSLSTLRLWGRALSYIKEDSYLKFAWSVLTKADFVAAQAQPEEASGVIDELLKTASGVNFVLLLSERDTGVHGSFRSVSPDTDVSVLAQLFGGGGHPQAAAFFLADSVLKDREHEIIRTLREHLGETSPAPSEPLAPLQSAPILPDPATPPSLPTSDTLTMQPSLPTQSVTPSEPRRNRPLPPPPIRSRAAGKSDDSTSSPEDDAPALQVPEINLDGMTSPAPIQQNLK